MTSWLKVILWFPPHGAENLVIGPTSPLVSMLSMYVFISFFLMNVFFSLLISVGKAEGAFKKLNLHFMCNVHFMLAIVKSILLKMYCQATETESIFPAKYQGWYFMERILVSSVRRNIAFIICTAGPWCSYRCCLFRISFFYLLSNAVNRFSWKCCQKCFFSNVAQQKCFSRSNWLPRKQLPRHQEE